MKAAHIATPEQTKNIITGTCLGLNSAISGAAIVTTLEISPQTEKEKGTNKGGNISELT